MAESSFLRWRNRFLVVALVCILLFILAVRLALPINLTAVDIGRHIANGQLICSGNMDILHKNYYSFTYPEYPFINHHWFFGVLAYIIFKAGGFSALSLFYIGIILAAVFLFLRAAFLRGHHALALLIAFLVLPLMWDRREIRPEGISLLMMGLYFYLLTKLSLGRINRWFVFVVLILGQILWVNTHIFFFMGPVLVAIFLWEGKNRGCSICVKQLVPLLVVTLGVNVLNPSGVEGMLTPLNIFKGFGYRLAENQNVFFMMSFFPKEKMYGYFLFLAFLGAMSMVGAMWFRRVRTNIPFIVILMFTLLAGLKAVRLMPAYALFLIPLGSFFFAQWLDKWPHKIQAASRIVMIFGACVIAILQLLLIKPGEVKIGLYPGVNASAEFYKANGLKGPIFSNYDIGGYLIYHLHGQEKVFVDNRQEAFPKEFFKELYMKMQQDDVMWQKMEGRYNFNTIYFYRHDLTEWGQNFLISRVHDLQWAPVFVDDFTIIFLKRNQENSALIERFELPKNMFGVSRK